MDREYLSLLQLHPDFPSYPVPHLKYHYPPATNDIVIRIAQIMLRESAFYYQVLHLMNKFNLEVPFDVPYTSLSDIPLPESEPESEMEDEPVVSPYLKRKMPEPRFPMRPVIKIKIKSTPDTLGTKEIAKPQCIVQEQEKIEEVVEVAEENLTVLTENEIRHQKTPPEQLANLPIFKSYNIGEKSDKLYIKNLAKQVTLADLKSIFYCYSSPDSIEIKLMDKKGKMKGQAFVTFKYFENDENSIEKVLQDVHGFMLKGKPMYVVYGKATENYKK